MSVYLVRELHFSPLQLVLMGTAMEAAVFLCEVPTGVVADTYSRRLSLIIGYLGMGVAWAAVGLVSAPWLIIALWALWGLSYTFTSGAEQAWITDEVGVENVGTRLPARRALRPGRRGASGCSRRSASAWSRSAPGVILGGVFTIACGLGCLAFMPEHGFRRRPREERGSALAEMRTTASAGARYAWAAPAILLLIGVELFMGASSEAFDRLKEAHFLRDVGLPGEHRPGRLVRAPLARRDGAEHRGDRQPDQARRPRRPRVGGALRCSRFVCLELVAMLVFALTGSVWLAVAGILGVFFARNMAGPLFDTWLNEQITDSSVRATVISLTGQANAIGQTAGGPVLGVVGNVWGIRAALAGGAAAIAPALGLFARAIAHHGREPELEQLPAPAVD